MTTLNEQQIIDAFKKNRPYLIDIEKLVKEVKFGTINLAIRVHDSRVTDIVTQIFQKVRYELGKDGSVNRVSDSTPLTKVDLTDD